MFQEAATLENPFFYFGRLAIWPGPQNNSWNFGLCVCPHDWEKFRRASEFDRPSGMGLLGAENIVNAEAGFISCWAHHRPLGAETLANT